MKIRNRKTDKPARAERRRTETTPKSKLKWPADRGWLVFIFILAFAMRLIYLLQIESIPLFYQLAGDGRTYDEWAQRIAAGDWLGQGVFYQAPLYPYFLGILQTFFGHDLWLIRLIQMALGALSCALIYRVGGTLFSREAGIASGLILAGYAPAIFFDGLIEKSILDLVLLSSLMLVIFYLKDGEHWIKWPAMGALLGLFGLSRENALILVLVMPFWIVISAPEQASLVRMRRVGLFLAGLMLVLMPVGLRNLAVGGEFKLTTSQFGPNFFIGNNSAADGTYGSVRIVIGEPQLEGVDAKRLAERAAGRTLKGGEVSSYWLRQSWDYMSAQPLDWLRLLGRKWLLVWNSREIEDSDDFYIYQQWSWLLKCFAWINHFGVIVPLAGAGIFLTIKQWRQLWLLYAMIVAIALSVAVFYVFGRYRFPLVPLLVLFAGAGLTELFMMFRRRNWRVLPAVAAVLGVSAFAVNWPILKMTGPGPGGYNNLSNAYDKQGKVNEAISTARKAIQVDPSYGIAHYNLANLYAKQGEFDLAQRHFEEAMRLYPKYAEVQSNLGQLLAQRGDIETGIQYFRKAIDLNPSLSRAHLNLGVALAKQGRIAEAVAPLQQAARLAVDSPEANYYLGSVFAAQNRYAEAAESFNQALRIQPDYAPAHQSLAQLLALQDKKDEAMQHDQEAVRLRKQEGAVSGKR
jgi:Tfp pilus assembly protein PilF/4-amino-4-deoxy-L-arabinose transferase-like glycosyltransferase